MFSAWPCRSTSGPRSLDHTDADTLSVEEPGKLRARACSADVSTAASESAHCSRENTEDTCSATNSIDFEASTPQIPPTGQPARAPLESPPAAVVQRGFDWQLEGGHDDGPRVWTSEKPLLAASATRQLIGCPTADEDYDPCTALIPCNLENLIVGAIALKEEQAHRLDAHVRSRSGDKSSSGRKVIASYAAELDALLEEIQSLQTCSREDRAAVQRLVIGDPAIRQKHRDRALCRARNALNGWQADKFRGVATEPSTEVSNKSAGLQTDMAVWLATLTVWPISLLQGLTAVSETQQQQKAPRVNAGADVSAIVTGCREFPTSCFPTDEFEGAWGHRDGVHVIHAETLHYSDGVLQVTRSTCN
eukprot:TRINITY_DN32322_c0_g1_i1.p1 TRINITY_DN32322_c0_g1~~TRINITY_DN32322_c0_g1_i1.p1  ORF type:complete len:363 (-),score=42.53 TRINITY_DN32322_c0_g1_i1:295-1383(-)